MTKESGSRNTDIIGKRKGVLDFPDGKRIQGLGKNEEIVLGSLITAFKQGEKQVSSKEITDISPGAIHSAVFQLRMRKKLPEGWAIDNPPLISKGIGHGYSLRQVEAAKTSLEIPVILPDGAKLVGLSKLKKIVLHLLIDRSLSGQSASKTELKEVYEASGIRKAGKDGITNVIAELNRILTNRNVDYAIRNLTSNIERSRGIESRYFFTISAPMLKTESPENPDIVPKPYKSKAELISGKIKKQIALRLSLNVLSYMARGETTRLNRLVQIHMEKAALSQGVTFLDIFGDMSLDQVKSVFIETIDSVMQAYWNSIAKNPSPEETELAQQYMRLKNFGYTRERVIQELRRYFDIPVPEKYIL